MRFNDNGTISLTIGADTFTLGRVTMAQLWHFHDRRNELAEDAKAKLEELAKKLVDAGEGTKAYEKLSGQMKDRRFAFLYMIEPWLREAFETVGSKPLPENLDDAPAEISDPGIVAEILFHWQTVPLAHSPRRTG